MLFRRRKISKDKKDSIENFKHHVSSGKVEFFQKYKMDFVMGFREGPWIFDIDGKKKLFNLYSNGGVFNLGHRNKKVIRVLKESLNFYDIGNHHLLSKPRADLAKMISGLMPDNLNYTIFGVSGGEAVDIALKIARGYTLRKKIISVEGGNHGHTGLAVLTGDEKYRKPFLMDSPDFIQVAFNDTDAVESALNDEVAAVIVETIPATLSIPLPDKDYLKDIKYLCEKNGSLLILDEVQNGLGRTGKLWAFEHFDVIPDMVVLAKGLSGGIYPISATVIDKKLEKVFHEDPFIHISTSGGAELGSVVAQKVLEISSEKKFLENVNKLSEEFGKELEKLQQKHSSYFKGIRRLGLMIGLEMKDELAGPIITKAAFDNDLLIVYADNDTSVVQFLPPLNIEIRDVKYVIKQFDKSLSKARILYSVLQFKNTLNFFLE